MQVVVCIVLNMIVIEIHSFERYDVYRVLWAVRVRRGREGSISSKQNTTSLHLKPPMKEKILKRMDVWRTCGRIARDCWSQLKLKPTKII